MNNKNNPALTYRMLHYCSVQTGHAATEVANLRRKHKISPPVCDGPPDFMRAMRAQ